MSIIPAPSHLVAIFEREGPSTAPARVECPVVALAEADNGPLRAICAVPRYQMFVPFEDAQKHLRRIHGGIYRFVEFAFVGVTGSGPGERNVNYQLAMLEATLEKASSTG